MIDWLFWLRVATVAAWTLAVMAGLPASLAVVTGKAVRHNDPIRLAMVMTGLLMIGFCLRWLLAPGSEEIFAMLYVLSILTAGYIFRLAFVYGRGERLDD